MANDDQPVAFNLRSAERINRVVRKVEGRQPPFMPGKRDRQVIASGLGLVRVAVTSSFAAAGWNKTANELTDADLTFPPLSQKDNGKWTFVYSTNPSAPTVSCKNGMATGVTIPAGKWRVGYVIAGVLTHVDCTDLDLPAASP